MPRCAGEVYCVCVCVCVCVCLYKLLQLLQLLNDQWSASIVRPSIARLLVRFLNLRICKIKLHSRVMASFAYFEGYIAVSSSVDIIICLCVCVCLSIGCYNCSMIN